MDTGVKTVDSTGRGSLAGPSHRARFAYFAIGIAAELILIIVSLILGWSDSTRLASTYILVMAYVPIATPLLFWRASASNR
jgi:hypothetical protein